MTYQVDPHLRHDFPRQDPPWPARATRRLWRSTLHLGLGLERRLPQTQQEEVLALRLLVAGLTLIVLVETIMLIVAAQTGFVR